MRILIPLMFAAAPVWADGCPQAPSIDPEMDRIFTQMTLVPDEASGRILNAALWELWLQAPDMASQDMLTEGMARMRVADYARAEEVLSGLITYCPWYAEGFNQRAFTYYLTERFALALVDLDAALALNPRHLGALTGKALTLIKMGRNAEAQPILREALALNPWLGERALLTDQDL